MTALPTLVDTTATRLTLHHLAEDVLAAVDDRPGTVMMMTSDGQVVWHPE